MKAYRSSLLVVSLASLALAGCGHGSTTGASGDLAVVNGEAISMDDYYRFLERKPAVQVEVPQAIEKPGVLELRTAQPLGFQALRDLINQKLLLDVARDEKVMPTADDVAKELAFQRARQPDFMQRLTGQGLTLDDIRRDLTIDLANERILTKGITETKADAEAYIKGHPEQFLQPEQAKMIVVLVKEKAKQDQVDADIKAGKPFGEIAAQYSEDPNVRQTQGVIVVNDVSKAPPGLQTLIENTKVNTATDWQPQPEGFAKAYMAEKVPAKPRTLTDNDKEAVRRQLAVERGKAASDLPQLLVNKLRASKIVVNSKSLQPLWDAAYKDAMEKDAQTAARSGAATPPPTTGGAGAAPTTPGTPPAAGKQ